MLEGLVSTIIPVYNRPRMLEEAVDSVLAQTYRPIEILIVDDASTDETPSVARNLAARHPDVVSLIALDRNGGAGVAREAGRLRARGEFIQHLDSDDMLFPRKFELQVAGLRANPDCGVSYGWTSYRLLDGTLLDGPVKLTGVRISSMFPHFLELRGWHTATPLYRRSVIDAAGAWTDLRVEEDWEYDCRIAALGPKLHYVEEWVAEIRGRSDWKSPLDPEVLRDRARAHQLILSHALRAGIGSDVAEMQRFARELFLLARQCGAAGLTQESKALLDAAQVATGPDAPRADFKLYKLLSSILGWRTMGKLSVFTDRFRS